MNRWLGMLKDKRLLIGAGIVAVIGIAALVRKRQTGNDAGGDTATDGSTPVRGAFDTSGTDMAAWVAEYVRNEMEAFRNGQPGGQSTPAPTGPVINVPRMPTNRPVPTLRSPNSGPRTFPIPTPRM